MIAKRVLRPRASSDFARLGVYILGEGRSTKDATPDRTFDYILADQAGGRVGAVRITNCHAGTPALAIMEILATQSLNKRSRGDRTYHLVVSFEPGERPAPAQIEDIETELCAAIGLSGHQRISALHLDRARICICTSRSTTRRPENADLPGRPADLRFRGPNRPRACQGWQHQPPNRRRADGSRRLACGHGRSATAHGRIPDAKAGPRQSAGQSVVAGRATGSKPIVCCGRETTFIADCIAATLQESETGLRLLCSLHRLDALRSSDIGLETLL